MSADPISPRDFIATLRLFCDGFEEALNKISELESRVQCQSQVCKGERHGCHKDKVCSVRIADHTDHYGCMCAKCLCPLCLFEISERSVDAMMGEQKPKVFKNPHRHKRRRK